MATVRPYKDKNGKIVSYHIEVFRGRDANGNKLKPYTTSWKVPDTYKSDKAIKHALDKFVGQFEASCKRGEVSAHRRTFGEYAKYYVELTGKDSKKTSIEFYNQLLPVILDELGYIKLDNLTTEHLNRFYAKLQTEDMRRDKKARGKVYLKKLKKTHGYTNKDIAAASGLSINTVDTAMQLKNIALASAEKIASAFEENVHDLFDIVSPNNNRLSANTVKHYHRFIHAILNLALHEGLITRNVSVSARLPKEPKKEPDFFEIEDIIKIREALEDEPIKYRIMIYLLCDTGIRRGELFGIRWKYIDFKNNTILIKENIQSVAGELYSDTTKAGDKRTITVSSEIINELRKYKKEQNILRKTFGDSAFNKEGYLFIQEDTGKVMHPSSLNIWLRRFEKRHNLPHIHPHKFRHSQASILYAAGIDIVTISNRLGHKQVSTTQNIYAHMMKESDRKASDAIANALYKDKS